MRVTVEQFKARFTWDSDPKTGCWTGLKGKGVVPDAYNVRVTIYRSEGAPSMKHGASTMMQRPPRLTYETFIGKTGSLVPHHSCGNTRCFNPAHLILGTGRRQKAATRRCPKCGETKPVAEMREIGKRHYVCLSHRGDPRRRPCPTHEWCSVCGRWKHERDFTRSPIFLGMCNACRFKTLHRWLEEHPKEWAQWRNRNSKQCRRRKVKHWAEKYKSDPAFKVLVCCRRRISNTLLRAYRSNGLVKESVRTRELIGCTIQELMGHLEKQFKYPMSWTNHGKWHMDHIRPLASFDLLDWEQCKQAYHWTNLRPLWARRNIRKGACWDGQLGLAI